MRHNFYIILLCMLFCGCGKESAPIPQDQRSLFNWKEVKAHFTENQCIYISAVMVGAIKNIRSFSLEVEPMDYNIEADLVGELNPKALCDDCPFMPKEVSKITPEKIDHLSKEDKAKYFFMYCPKIKAKVYRWRLVISNIFTDFPYIITPVVTSFSSKY